MSIRACDVTVELLEVAGELEQLGGTVVTHRISIAHRSTRDVSALAAVDTARVEARR